MDDGKTVPMISEFIKSFKLKIEYFNFPKCFRAPTVQSDNPHSSAHIKNEFAMCGFPSQCFSRMMRGFAQLADDSLSHKPAEGCRRQRSGISLFGAYR